MNLFLQSLSLSLCVRVPLYSLALFAKMQSVNSIFECMKEFLLELCSRSMLTLLKDIHM